MSAGSQTFAAKLKSAGYYTAAAEKWHLGDVVRDHFYKVYKASKAGFVLPSGKGGQPPKVVAEQPSGCEDWERALEESPKDKPFFMWLAALDPHREYTEGSLDPPHNNSDIIVPPHLPDTPDEFDRVTGEPDHSVRVRPRRSKLQMFGTNGKY